jgi:hypothetical protein
VDEFDTVLLSDRSEPAQSARRSCSTFDLNLLNDGSETCLVADMDMLSRLVCLDTNLLNRG